MTDLIEARRIMEADELAFVIVREGQVLARGSSNGVGELLAAVDRLGAQTCGASLADKVVGKAVAFIAVSAGMVAVETPLASEAAVQVLQSCNITVHAAAIVPHILNRRGDGWCPLEKLTRPIDQPAVALARLREFIASRPMVPTAAPAGLTPPGCENAPSGAVILSGQETQAKPGARSRP